MYMLIINIFLLCKKEKDKLQFIHYNSFFLFDFWSLENWSPFILVKVLFRLWKLLSWISSVCYVKKFEKNFWKQQHHCSVSTVAYRQKFGTLVFNQNVLFKLQKAWRAFILLTNLIKIFNFFPFVIFFWVSISFKHCYFYSGCCNGQSLGSGSSKWLPLLPFLPNCPSFPFLSSVVIA